MTRIQYLRGLLGLVIANDQMCTALEANDENPNACPLLNGICNTNEYGHICTLNNHYHESLESKEFEHLEFVQREVDAALRTYRVPVVTLESFIHMMQYTECTCHTPITNFILTPPKMREFRIDWIKSMIAQEEMRCA